MATIESGETMGQTLPTLLGRKSGRGTAPVSSARAVSPSPSGAAPPSGERPAAGPVSGRVGLQPEGERVGLGQQSLGRLGATEPAATVRPEPGAQRPTPGRSPPSRRRSARARPVRPARPPPHRRRARSAPGSSTSRQTRPVSALAIAAMASRSPGHCGPVARLHGTAQLGAQMIDQAHATCSSTAAFSAFGSLGQGGGELGLVEPVVVAVGGQQLVVGALLDDRRRGASPG